MKKITFFFLLLVLLSCKNSITSHLSEVEVLQPELFLPGIVTSLETQEFGMTISPIDAKKILFTRRIGDEKQKIYETNYINGKWSKPVITSFSTDRDESPHFSRDGKSIYFGSERELKGQPNKGNFDMNVWKATFENNKWNAPIALSNTVNKVQIEGEEWPSSNVSQFVTIDDKTFYTGTQVRGEKGLDLYKTTFNGKTFTELEKLPKEINSEDLWEYAPVLSYDGNYLFFQVYRGEEDFGGDDIYVTKKDENGKWLPCKNLGEIVNTNMNECPAAISCDGKYFFFTRDYKKDPKEYDGISSIYFLETKALELEKLFKSN